MLHSIRLAHAPTYFPRAGFHPAPRFYSFVQNFLKEQPHASSKQLKDVKVFVKSHSVLEHANPKSILHKINLLKMMDQTSDQLQPTKITRVINSIGFVAIKTEFLSYIELLLSNGGAPYTSLEESAFFAQLSRRVQQIKTIEDLQKIYSEIKKSPYFERFRKGFAPEERLFDFLILKQIHPQTYSVLKYNCLNLFHFLSSENRYMDENSQVFEKAKKCFETIFQDVQRSPKAFFTEDPQIDFWQLENFVAASLDQVCLRRSFYNSYENFKLKSWDEITHKLKYRPRLYMNKSPSLHKLWNLLESPEKAKLVFPVDEKLLDAYTKAMKSHIADSMSRDDERQTNYRHTLSLYNTANPKIGQIRQKAVEEIKEALINGRYAELEEEMDYMIKRYVAVNS